METNSLNERATEFVMAQIVKRENGKEINVGEYKSRIKDVSELLTEQDSIAHQEEKERCIQLAQMWYCENKCSLFRRLHTCPMCDRWNCNETEDIRRAMEGGEE